MDICKIEKGDDEMDTNNIVDGIKTINPEWGNLADDVVSKIIDAENSLEKVNLIVAGKTGVGKSTLINACFRKKIAETGIGRPVTCKTQIIEDAEMPLRIYDTVGLELTESTKSATINDIHTLIEDNKGTDKEIHCVWYCVLTASNRFEQAEEDLIGDIVSLNVPVILVLTQADKKNKAEQFKKKICKEIGTKANKIQLVLAEDDEDKSAYGKDDLIKSTCEFIQDEELKLSWINASSCWELKRAEAIKAVYAGCLGAAAATIIPIPAADSIAIGTAQISMMAAISRVYGVSVSKAQFLKLLGALSGVVGASFVGRTVFSGIMKMFPGVGSIAGTAIAFVPAVILTYGLGCTFIKIMEMVSKNETSLDNLDMDFISRIMKGNMENASNYVKQSVTDGKLDIDAFERISREHNAKDWGDTHDKPITINNTPPKVPVQYRREVVSKKNSSSDGLLQGVTNFFSKKFGK